MVAASLGDFMHMINTNNLLTISYCKHGAIHTFNIRYCG